MSDLRPAAYPPPVTKDEFIAAPVAPEDERLEVGALFVGGGPAGLAGAIRLAQLIADDAELTERLGETPIAVVDKGSGPGAHQLSGAVVNPGPLKELFPGKTMEEMTSYGPVGGEAVYLLGPKKALKLPTPPPFKNHGNYIFSLSLLTRWLAEQAEELGVMVIPETAADRLLVTDGVVHGVRTGDKGRGKEGEELPNFEPGAELHAQMTVLTEGTQGHLAGALLDHFDLHADPQVWALGVKEIWKVAKPLEKIIHTLGWPLRKPARYREFGGSFIYPMGPEHICLGFVTGLDTADATVSVHDTLQLFKTHPFIKELLEGATRVAWGAKTIPEGGFWSLPTQLSVPGAMIAGDSAGMVNGPKLKGVHLAMRAGMLAAEAMYARLKSGETLVGADLDGYDEGVKNSEIHRDLYRSRNMKQPFAKGFFAGGAIVNAMEATGGRFPGGHWPNHADAEQPLFIGDAGSTYPTPDGKLTFDKLSSVFISGNQTRDDQPDHIRVEHQLPRAVATAYVAMCPAAVYELPEGSESGPDDEIITMKVNPSNCVHCGAITAKGGRLTPPEGGSGPEYTNM
ncbi:MAG: 4Fe-4S dicluster domain-containing protein [Thermoleophilia bacterium]|nr:4Fe-4S dicluster domain-containing protein [Thermoleophilia bacterium]